MLYLRNRDEKHSYKRNIQTGLTVFELLGGKKPKSLASLHHQNALKYFLHSIHRIQALKDITNKKTTENHQKCYQAI